MDKIKALFYKHRETVMYLFFGGVTTVVSMVSFAVFNKYVFGNLSDIHLFGLSLSLGILLSETLSWALSVSVAFVTNKLWVFDSKSWEKKLVAKEAATFFGGRVLTGVFGVIAIPLLVSVGLNQTLFGHEALPAKIIVNVAVLILNFLISKFVSFNRKEKS